MYYSKHYIKITPEALREMADDIEYHAKHDGLANYAWITFRDNDGIRMEMLFEQPDANRKKPDPNFRDATGSFTTFYGFGELSAS